MTLFEKILIATDGSERNQSAVEKGLEIARACGSTVYAVYVIEEKMLTSAPSEVSTAGVYAKLEEEGESAVKRVQSIAKGANVEPVVLSGRTAHEITRFAQEKKVDLIVIGTLGKSGIGRLILGSVAEMVIRTSDCPVMVVRSK